jgi:hypothetical protein
VQLFRNPTFLSLAAVLLGGAFIGLPRVADFSDHAKEQDGQLENLQTEVDRLTTMQLELQGGIQGYRAALEAQKDLIVRQADRIEAQKMRLRDGFDRIDGLSDSVNAQATLAAAKTPRALRAELRRDILRPVFQVSGEDAVGSAVLVHRGQDENGGYYLALSCYHVLRDIVAVDPEVDPHTVSFDNIFDYMGEDAFTLQGKMIAEWVEADLALIRIETDMDLGKVARLAPRERLYLVDAFTPVYTVGCPLGTNAQATRGEVTRNDWDVQGQPYWMVSSPAYFGNSGGGVFLEETHELVGVFSKIYTHGTYRPQVVTHMGLAVPLGTIHDWLEEIGYGHLLPTPLLERVVQAEEASSASEQ